jgi:MSHA pilin protein MshA
LVIVIAILGILGAVALPKFANLTTQARTAAFQGVKAGFTSGVMIVHSSWLADGAVGADTTVTLEGGQVVAITAGWPDAAATIWGDIMNGPMPSDWTSSVALGVATFTDGAATAFEYDSSSGEVTVP